MKWFLNTLIPFLDPRDNGYVPKSIYKNQKNKFFKNNSGINAPGDGNEENLILARDAILAARQEAIQSLKTMLEVFCIPHSGYVVMLSISLENFISCISNTEIVL